MRFDDKVAIVTGGGSGIGRETVRILATEGASVVIADHDAEAAEKARLLAVECGAPEAVAVEADMSTEDGAVAVAAACRGAFGRADALVNNAAARVWGPVTDASVESWRHIADVNLVGPALTCKHVIPLFGAEGGAIVNVSSANGVSGRPGMAQYDATKAGILGLTRSMACDHAAGGIRVNAVLPGPTLTDFHKKRAAAEGREVDPSVVLPHDGGPGILRRQGRPEEIAAAIAFLVSDDASYMTGACVPVDGGLTAMSGRLL